MIFNNKLMQNLLRVAITTPALIGLVACNNNAGANPNQHQLNKFQQNFLNQMPMKIRNTALVQDTLKNDQTLKDVGQQENPVRLGFGIDDRTGMPKTASCMANINDPKAISFVNPSSSINFTATTSSSTVSQHMNIALSGKANFGLYSGSIAAEYTRDSNDTRQSLNFNYLGRYEATAVYNIPGLGNKILSADAQDALNNGGGLNEFFRLCGNSVIDHAKRGALLAVDVSIEFANAASKDQFSEHVNVKAMGIGEISEAFTKERETSTSGARLVVKALQLGGDTTKLARIFGKPGPDGSYNVTKCVMQQVDYCSKLIDNIVSYAQNDFEPSVDYTDEKKSYTFAYGTTKFEELGIKAHLPELTTAEQEANQYLATTITQDRRMLQYITAYQQQTQTNAGGIPQDYSMMDNVDSMTKILLPKIQYSYQAMIDEYTNYGIIDSCYGDTNNLEAKCISAANHVKNMHLQNQKYKDFANNLANTVVVYTPTALFRYVPRNVNSFCKVTNGKHECYGEFAQFADKYPISDGCSYCFHNTVLCDIDTTLNASYLNSEQSLKCVGTKFGNLNIFVKKDNPNNFETGIWGIYKNGQPEYYGRIQYYFSDSSDFLYNPI